MLIIFFFLVFQALHNKTKMNKFAYRQNALVGFGEIAVSKGIVCPKPRRSGLFNSASVQVNETFTTNAPLLQIKYVSLFFSFFFIWLSSICVYLFGCFSSQEVGGCDLKAGAELLDMILTKVSSHS